MNKKAITQQELVLLIFVIAVAAVLAGGVYIYIKQMKAGAGIEGCRESILFQQEVAEETKETIKPKIACPAPSIDVKSKEKNEELRLIADQLKDCWYKSLGKANKMGYRWSFLYPDWDVCLVCSEFALNQDIAPSELIDFLDIAKPKGSELTYREFLEDASWGWDKVLRSSPSSSAALEGIWGKTPIAIIEANADKLTDTVLYKSTPETEKKYYVIALNAYGSTKTNYNQPFIVEKGNLPNVKCDVFYYNPAKT